VQNIFSIQGMNPARIALKKPSVLVFRVEERDKFMTG